MKQSPAYDDIAEEYQASKWLPFRHYVERYTLLDLLGDVRGLTVLDMACGEGVYARQFKREGATEVTGVDVSREMVELAREQERAEPLGCRYVCADAGDFTPDAPVDAVTAIYLLNYARTRAELERFCRACHRALRPGGGLVGFNDNVRRPPRPGSAQELAKYGFERTCPFPPSEGDAIRYRMTLHDDRVFEFDNYYLTPATYDAAMRAAGFADFRWVDARLEPSEREDPFWRDFFAHAPLTAFTARKA